jgi:transposase-like protein
VGATEKIMKLTRVKKKKYMDKGGNECPFCGSTKVEVSRSFDADGLSAWRDVSCIDCKKEWTDVYTLTDIEEI